MTETDARVDELMANVPLHDALNWCESDLCACPGCVNRSRRIPITKRMWERWVERQFVTQTEFEDIERRLIAGEALSKDEARRLFTTIKLRTPER